MKAISIMAVILSAGIAAYVYTGCKPVWQYDSLERNARKVITDAELYSFATNVLARHPAKTHTTLSVADLGANFPRQLVGLAPRLGPHVEVYQWDDT